MQRHIQQDKARKRRNKTILFLASFIVLVVVVTQVIANATRTREPEARLLRCYANQSVTPFGQNVLYYDGTSIHCLSTADTHLWSYPIGPGGDFSVSEDGRRLIAWSDSNLFIIDHNGKATYNDNLGKVIQHARISGSNAAAIIGDRTSPTLTIKDWSGAHLDEESLAYQNMVLLDIGFFGDQQQIGRASCRERV